MNISFGWKGKKTRVILAVIMLLTLIELLHIAWIGDDAAITLRTVLNLNYGYGPVYNIAERVQAYSHPLWFISIAFAHLFARNVVLVTYVLSIATSMAVMWLVITKVAPSLMCACVAAGLLLVSKAYVDFSASGLENPLSHLVLVATFIAAARVINERSERWYRLLLLLGSLSYLTRPDLVLFYIPVALYVTYVYRPGWWNFIKWSFIAAIPCLVWTLFTLFYYGLPVPNTALAKLSGGLPLVKRIAQGGKYFRESFATDPVTLLTISFAIIVGLIRSAFDRSLVIGIVLYLLYVLSIGGDFMSGRFFTGAFIVSVVIISRLDRLVPRAAALLVALGALYLYPNVLKRSAVGMWDHSTGIVDERRFYYPRTTLLYANERLPNYKAKWRDFDAFDTPPRVLRDCGGIGYIGIRGGPGLHVIDECALSEPLIVSLGYFTGQRIGHWRRVSPTNYELSILEDRNLLAQDELRPFYDEVREVTRGNLFSSNRLKIILKWLLGGRAVFPEWSATKPDRFTPGAVQTASAKQLARRIIEGGAIDDQGTLLMMGIPLEVSLEQPTVVGAVDVSLDADDRYLIEYFDGQQFKTLFELGPQNSPDMAQYLVQRVHGGPARYRREVTGDKPLATKIRITAIKPDRGTAVGHLRISPSLADALATEVPAK